MLKYIDISFIAIFIFSITLALSIRYPNFLLNIIASTCLSYTAASLSVKCVFGVESLQSRVLCYASWVIALLIFGIGYFILWFPGSDWTFVFLGPLGAFVLQWPLWGIRYLFKIHLECSATEHVRESWSIREFLVGTFFVCLVFALARYADDPKTATSMYQYFTFTAVFFLFSVLCIVPPFLFLCFQSLNPLENWKFATVLILNFFIFAVILISTRGQAASVFLGPITAIWLLKIFGYRIVSQSKTA